jgi:branched-chain amino acid transport system ATP-binding protein
LLDEPSMGLAPTIADLIFDRIAALHREDRVTLLLVEQRVAEALESCDYGYVLEAGEVVLEGSHHGLMADDRVRRAYLGM